MRERWRDSRFPHPSPHPDNCWPMGKKGSTGLVVGLKDFFPNQKISSFQTSRGIRTIRSYKWLFKYWLIIVKCDWAKDVRTSGMKSCISWQRQMPVNTFFSLYVFWRTHSSFFSSVAPHRGQPAAKCHPRWQPTRRLAVSCGLGRHQIWTRVCRTTVWCATIEPPRLPQLSHHASQHWATMPPNNEPPRLLVVASKY